MKKLFIVLLGLVLANPAAAYDFGAAAIVAGLAIGGAALALTFGAPAAIGTVAIGAIVAGITFDTGEPSASTSDDIEAQLSPAAKLATPAGWTEAAAGQVEPTPPATADPVTVYQVTSQAGSAYESQAAALASYIGGSITDARCAQGAGCYIEYFSTTYNSWVLTSSQVLPISSCPTGYTMVANVCELGNAAQVMKPTDDKCTIKRTGNSFAVDPRDPDCASGKIPATTAVAPNTITQVLPSGISRSVTIEADGSTTVSESRPNNTTNTTETNTTKLSAPNASGAVSVTGQGSGVVPGTGTLVGTGNAPTIDTSGLATEGTLGGIKADTGAIKDALTGEGVDGSLSAEKSLFDSAVEAVKGLFDAEPTKELTGVSDDFTFGGYLPAACGCTPLSVEWQGHSASYDWCGPMEVLRGALAWVLGLVTAFSIIMMFRPGSN